MFTAAKENEFKDEAEVEGLVRVTKALNYSREPRYSIKRRERTPDSLADETRSGVQGRKMYIVRKRKQEKKLITVDRCPVFRQIK